MLIRTWHGWTLPENADAYERLLRTEIFPGILNRKISGLRGIELFRREADGETEFMTLFRFDGIEDVRQLAGDDPEAAYVPPAARKVLKRFDERARHFELRETGYPA